MISIKKYTMDQILNNAALTRIVRDLTMCSSSGMNRSLTYYGKLLKNNQPVNAYALLLKQDDKTIAWACVSREQEDRWMSWFEPREGLICMFYVAPQYRRNGYGKMLFNKIKELEPGQAYCFAPHDEASCQFFNSIKGAK